jgi:hypothetical protein
MTWVDLAAVALILWSAVKGYLRGVGHMIMQLAGLMAAAVGALALRQPFAVYLQQEWRAVAVFVGYLTRRADAPLQTGGAGARDFALPALAGPLLRWLSGEPETLAVLGQEAGKANLGPMLLSFFAATLACALLAFFSSWLLRVRLYRNGLRSLPEWQKLLGLLPGVAVGWAWWLFCLLVLDAVSLFGPAAFWVQDIQASLLYKIAVALLWGG